MSDKKLAVGNFKSIPGKGAEGTVDGHEVKVVSPGYLRERQITLDDKRIELLQAQGKTVVFILVDGQLKGAMALADIIRPEAKQAITALKALNIRCMMLTGDNQATAQWVSDPMGLNEVFAEVLPQDKAAKVKALQARGGLVAMTGDGVNDAPALAQADVGIAIGAGSDVAVETADIVLVRSNPMDVVAIVEPARANCRKRVQHLVWAAGYNVVAIPLAADRLKACASASQGCANSLAETGAAAIDAGPRAGVAWTQSFPWKVNAMSARVPTSPDLLHAAARLSGIAPKPERIAELVPAMDGFYTLLDALHHSALGETAPAMAFNARWSER